MVLRLAGGLAASLLAACTGAVRAPSTLAAGTVVYFRTLSELDGHLSAPVQGHADGAFVSTDPSLGIEELTWPVISR